MILAQFLIISKMYSRSSPGPGENNFLESRHTLISKIYDIPAKLSKTIEVPHQKWEEDMNGLLLKEGIKMANGHMKN